MKPPPARLILDELLMHPRHQSAQTTLVGLIEQLRACTTVADGYAFQQEPLRNLLSVEVERNSLSQAVKRLVPARFRSLGRRNHCPA